MLNSRSASIVASFFQTQSSLNTSRNVLLPMVRASIIVGIVLLASLLVAGCGESIEQANQPDDPSWMGSESGDESGDFLVFPDVSNGPSTNPEPPNGEEPFPCEPDCSEVECGDNGCGSSCGDCAEGTSCSEEGFCEEGCLINCLNKECGDDGCEGLCGSCEIGTSCDENFECVEPPENCTPSCLGKECGDNGCQGLCGSCAPDEFCNDSSLCELICIPNCTNKFCGSDGCEGSCGTCEAGTQCEAGSCVCYPQCENKFCGDDGCGGICGECTGCDGPDSALCEDGQCATPCCPDCEGKSCGSNGCGGLCGMCADDETCGDNQCEWVGSESIAHRFYNPSSKDHRFVMSTTGGPPTTPVGYIAEGPWFKLDNTPAATITLHQWNTYSGGYAMGVNLSGPEGWPNVQNPQYLGKCSPDQLNGMVPLVGLFHAGIPDTLATFGDEVDSAQAGSGYGIIQTWCYVTPVYQ